MEGRIHIYMSVSCKTPRFGQLGLEGGGTLYRTLPFTDLCVIPPTVVLLWEETLG